MKGVTIIFLALIIISMGLISSYYNTNQIEEIIELKSEFEADNYIQSPHYKIRYSTRDGLKIQAVDYCNSLTGSSMQPAVFTGNTLCFEEYHPSKKTKLKEGMVIEFESEDGGKTAHRIKAIYNDYILTQGDNSDYYETVEYDMIRGIHLATIPT